MSESNLVLVPCNNDAEWKRRIREAVQDTSCIIWTDHAQQRMSERDISTTEVICVLEDGNFIEGPYKSAKGNYEFKMRQHISGEFISVVGALDIDEGGDIVIVITMFGEQ